MTRRRPLPPGLADAIANSKRLTQELLALRHDCELIFAAPTDSNLSLLRSRAFMVQEQTWALSVQASTIYDAIREAKEAAERAASPRGPFLALSGGR